MYKLLSAFIGVLITIMILLNGVLSQRLGNYTSTLIIHFLGFIVITLILTIKKIKISFSKDIPIYLYSGGLLGVFTILFNNISFNQLGTSLTLALGLLGQSICSLVLDHYGWLGMEVVHFRKEKLIGLTIIASGIIVMTLY
ncbi:MAG TPA: DMT family transporter [Patescibacteria group bacterium]|jgi:transporter family-2 protein|nr:DMT family transporter [Patescibacteria group bacterium]